ncbi:MAG: peroxiredoxin [Thaumarchaeota archaeon]|nr:peroxiredoxin [Nitrososphaerota archaeon]
MSVEVGQKAPDFTLLNTERKPISLKDLSGKKLIVAFFPGAFTGVCTKELCTFRDSLQNLSQLGANIVAISVDSPFANKGFAEKNGLNFPLLSDYNRETISRYGIVLKNFAGIQGYDTAKRSVFVLDAQGTVRYRWVSDDPGKEPPYEEVTKAVKATN